MLAEEVGLLQELIAEIAARYDSAESPEFLMDAPVLAHRLPGSLRSALNRFRLTEPASGIVVISGFPVAEEKIGATPEHWWRPAGSCSSAHEHEILLVLTSSLLGDCIGWSTQQGGRVIHDVLPIRGMEQEQIGTGSEQSIWWHTEDAFHPLRGDYLGLLCLRNPDRVPTTFASLECIQMEADDWEALFEPRFKIRPDQSHQKSFGAAESARDDEIDGLYRHIEGMLRAPEDVAIFSGDPRSPYLRIDPYFMDSPDDPRARRALAALVRAIDTDLNEIVLEPGDICFIDNFKAVHGRRGFKARYDGRDRWLKRINITRDLRKSRSKRANSTSRTILF